jgi:hypothetical protein
MEVIYKNRTKRDHTVLDALGGVVIFFALVAIAPGALVTFAVEHLFGLRLEIGQRWTFAVAASVLIACVFCLRSRSGWGGAYVYMLLSTALAGTLLVCHFGFHAEWAAALFTTYRP